MARLCKVLCDEILSRVIFVLLEDTDIRVAGYVSIEVIPA